MNICKQSGELSSDHKWSLETHGVQHQVWTDRQLVIRSPQTSAPPPPVCLPQRPQEHYLFYWHFRFVSSDIFSVHNDVAAVNVAAVSNKQILPGKLQACVITLQRHENHLAHGSNSKVLKIFITNTRTHTLSRLLRDLCFSAVLGFFPGKWLNLIRQ